MLKWCPSKVVWMKGEVQDKYIKLGPGESRKLPGSFLSTISKLICTFLFETKAFWVVSTGQNKGLWVSGWSATRGRNTYTHTHTQLSELMSQIISSILLLFTFETQFRNGISGSEILIQDWLKLYFRWIRSISITILNWFSFFIFKLFFNLFSLFGTCDLIDHTLELS